MPAEESLTQTLSRRERECRREDIGPGILPVNRDS